MIYMLPRSRLKRENNRLDWIDNYESMTVDIEFCNWLAKDFGASSPTTKEIVAQDANVCLYRLNDSFARAIAGGDPDVFDGVIGGNSASKCVTSYPTWMTQRQAWTLRGFLCSAMRDDHVLVELRIER